MRKRNVNRKIGRNIEKAIKSAAKNGSLTASIPQGPIILFAAPVESLDPSVLAAKLTAYYQEHKEGIHSMMELGLFEGQYSLERQFTLLPGIVDELVLDSATVEDFLHQHMPNADDTFNPTENVLTPDARILKVRDYEGDLQFKDKQIERTHLMWKGKMKQLEKTDSPDKTKTFIEYLFWDIIIAKAKRSLRKAVFQATFAQTSGFSSSKILNGWEKIISDEIAATSITPTAVGSITTSNVVTKVESVYDTLDITVQEADDLVCALDAATFKAWIRADRQALGRTWNYDATKEMVLDENSNCVIIKEPDFTTTKIAFYQRSNAFVGTHSGNEGSWEFQRQDRLTKMMLNGKIGLQFQTVNPGSKNNIAIGQ